MRLSLGWKPFLLGPGPTKVMVKNVIGIKDIASFSPKLLAD